MNTQNKKSNVHPILLVVMSGLALLLLAFPAATFLQSIHRYWSGNPEMAVVVSVMLFIALVSFPSIIYLTLNGRRSKPELLGLVIIAAVCLGLVAIYFFWVSAFIRFPADILIWSESDFVNDILKIKTGYPLYTNQANNESFIYPPGVQVITHLVSLLIGNPGSIPVYRSIQVVFAIIAAGIALFSAMKLSPSEPFSKPLNAVLWGITGNAMLFLIATNVITNPFTHNLHNDSLAQLVAIAAFLLLVLYSQTGKTMFLIGMAVLPGLGFLVKQSLAIWAGLYLFYMIFFDRPFSLRKTLLFGLSAFGCILLAVASGYALWGDDFWYWVIIVLRQRGVSLLRSIEHFTLVWPFVLAGFFGGLVNVKGDNFQLIDIRSKTSQHDAAVPCDKNSICSFHNMTSLHNETTRNLRLVYIHPCPHLFVTKLQGRCSQAQDLQEQDHQPQQSFWQKVKKQINPLLQVHLFLSASGFLTVPIHRLAQHCIHA